MPKRLTPQAKAQRLHDQGFSDRQIAKATGYSASSVGRIRRGQQSGEKIAAPLNEFFKLGKRAKANVVSGVIPLPSAKPAPAKAKPSIVERVVEFISPMRRAEGKISQYDADTKVVVQLTNKQTGKSRTLFARGGIEAGEISGNFGSAIAAQGESQYGDDDDVDYADYDIWDIDIDEY